MPKYSNREIARRFAKGCRDGVNNNGTIYISGNVIYSYGHHWPMALRDGRTIYVNRDRYSPTTSKQTSCVGGACRYEGLNVVDTTLADIVARDRKQQRSR